jgi:hypothetical protein
LRHSRTLFLFTLLVLIFWISPIVQSAPTLTINPTSQAVPQASAASYTVSLSGGAANATYALTLTGLPTGMTYSFSPSTIRTSGSSVLTIQTSSPPLYCPGSYSFTVLATNVAASSDSTSTAANLIVTPIGQPLSVTVSTDKSIYTTGENVTISVSINMAAQGTLTITPPSGTPSAYQYQYSTRASFTKSYSTTNRPTGRWAVTFQADDYCGGTSRATANFDVVADTYPVSISLSGVPSSISVNIQVDGQNQGSLVGSETKSLSFKAGTQHSISVDPTVLGDTGVRYAATQSTWSFGSTGSHTFNYITQYYLTIGTAPDGVIQIAGTGWYAPSTPIQEGAPQTVNTAPGTIYAFSRWEVDGIPQTGNPIVFMMDKPHTAIARYQLAAVTTSVITSASTRTSTTSATSTTVATGTISSTSILTQTGRQTISNIQTSSTTIQQTATITSTTSQILTSTSAIVQFEDPALEMELGSILTISALVVLVTLLKRSAPRKQAVCSKCGFKNPRTATLFCVNCGQPLSQERSR